MKKITIIFLCTTILLACDSSTSKKPGNKEHSHNNVENTSAEKHATNIEGLTLNNGAKWNGDEATNNNVKNLEDILHEFRTSAPPETKDYVTLSDSLQVGLNKMIAECRMKGADHDALHQWLEPLIGKVKNLKAIGDVETGATATNDIKEHVQLYHAFFE